jgi:hypothetical protein
MTWLPIYAEENDARPPAFWRSKDYILDSLDKQVESLQHPSLYPFLVLIILLHLYFVRKKIKWSRRLLRRSILAGSFWLVSIATYSYIHRDSLTITSKTLAFTLTSVLSHAGNFLFTV